MDTTDAERGGEPVCVVGIGASAGGVDALTRLVRELPPNLRAAICVVVHVPSSGHSLLAPILDRETGLHVVEAEAGAMRERRIYVAPNDRHMLIADGHLRLDRGPKENGARPAVDPMLRTLAAAYGPRAVAVILSGALGDGSAGAVAVQRAGGSVIVQDPADATVPSMPASALRAVGKDAVAVLDLAGIARLLTDLVGTVPAREDVVMTAKEEPYGESPVRPDGPPIPFTCPECSGPLWEIREGQAVRYTCRVGHSYSEDAMVVEQGNAVEAALWAGLEALEERAEFLQRMADRHGEGRSRLSDRYNGAAADALQRAELIRRALGTSSGHPHALDPPEAEDTE